MSVRDNKSAEEWASRWDAKGGSDFDADQRVAFFRQIIAANRPVKENVEIVRKRIINMYNVVEKDAIEALKRIAGE